MRKDCVLIEAKKEAYDTTDCVGKALTVGELKRLLEDFHEDSPVIVSNDGGYTYGALTAYRLGYAAHEDTEEDEN